MENAGQLNPEQQKHAKFDMKSNEMYEQSKSESFISQNLSTKDGEEDIVTPSTGMNMKRFKKNYENFKIRQNMGIRPRSQFKTKEENAKAGKTPRVTIKENLLASSDITKRIDCITKRSNMKSTRKYIHDWVASIKDFRGTPLKTESESQNNALSDAASKKCFFGRSNTYSKFRKYSGESEKEELPTTFRRFTRLQTIGCPDTQKMVLRRQSTERVKFENFTESHRSECKRSESEAKKTIPSSHKEFMNQKEKEREFRKRVMQKLKQWKNRQKNPFNHTQNQKVPQVLVREQTEKNLLDYARKMHKRMKSEACLPEETSVKSRQIANNIVRMREKFSIADHGDNVPSRKFLAVDPNLKFGFKRRSVDFIDRTEIKSRVQNSKLLKLHDDDIIEVGHQDFKVKAPTPKKVELFKVSDEDVKLPKDANMMFVTPLHFFSPIKVSELK